MVTAYKLSDQDRANLEFAGDQNVIAASPWRKGSGELPNRVVLREFDDEFVVHRQCLPDEGATHRIPSFCYGYYFPKHDGDGSVFEGAWLRFEERSRTHLGINNEE